MIAAITTCPTGIAHTYMAADSLASADVVIFATDIGVRDRERFKGKRILKCSPRQAIRDPNDTLSAALALINTPVNTAAQPQTTHRVSDTAYDLERKMRHAAMTGVSYMDPFVAAGGFLLALGFLLGGYDIATGWQAIAVQHSRTDLPSHDVIIDTATG
ncbi:PTS system fructose-specific EIIB'BC component [Corynebacterium rouxii]|uniref:PTS system fructose-specific EIIB'BC component n=2 Tax=Corynebacterium rouxii TaxID=2719119 RepID=A0A6I8MCR0_9CORY|nr:PTS system fructose-specific EIIB'BC component [Corynebacterium rouxii]